MSARAPLIREEAVVAPGGRVLDRFPIIVARLQQILERFMDNLYCMDATFVSDDMLDQLPTPSYVGRTRIGGIDLNKPRTRAVLMGALALACSAGGFTVKQFAATVIPMLATSTPNYGARQAAYDLKKLRGKNLLTRSRQIPTLLYPSRSHSYDCGARHSPRKSPTSDPRGSRENHAPSETEQSQPDRRTLRNH